MRARIPSHDPTTRRNSNPEPRPESRARMSRRARASRDRPVSAPAPPPTGPPRAYTTHTHPSTRDTTRTTPRLARARSTPTRSRRPRESSSSIQIKSLTRRRIIIVIVRVETNRPSSSSCTRARIAVHARIASPFAYLEPVASSSVARAPTANHPIQPRVVVVGPRARAVATWYLTVHDSSRVRDSTLYIRYIYATCVHSVHQRTVYQDCTHTSDFDALMYTRETLYIVPFVPDIITLRPRP